MKIEGRVEYWKSKLLDLGKTNKMINCSISGRSSKASIVIKVPEIYDLWKLMNNKGIQFPLKCKTGKNDEGEDIDLVDTFSNEYKTSLSVNDTLSTLRKLNSKTKEYLENKGVNILYIVYGFLNWKDKGTSGVEYRSPLVLMPISMNQSSIISPIELTRTEDDFNINLALAKKLKIELNMDLPEFNEGDTLEDYFNIVENFCKHLGWYVEKSVAQIMLLNYTKIPMYYDLEKHVDEVYRHELINLLNGDGSNIKYEHIDNINHDEENIDECFSVVDADSSQQDAISMAKRGVSFVLQGPPGTGKSQTITNIISELLGQGKKVLFVSEKMAALDVVYKRLKGVGLQDFCLTLHNPNAKRNEIMDQIREVVQLSNNRSGLFIDSLKLEKLVSVRDDLNEFVRQLNTVIEPLGMSVYEVNSELGVLGDIVDIDFVQDGVEYINAKEFLRNIDILNEYQRVIIRNNILENPWYGCKIEELTYSFRQKFAANSNDIVDYMGKLIDSTNINKYFDMDIDNVSYDVCRSFISLYDYLSNNLIRVDRYLFNIDIEQLLLVIDIYQRAVSNHNKLVNNKEKVKAISDKIYVLLKEIIDKYETGVIHNSDIIDLNSNIKILNDTAQSQIDIDVFTDNLSKYSAVYIEINKLSEKYKAYKEKFDKLLEVEGKQAELVSKLKQEISDIENSLLFEYTEDIFTFNVSEYKEILETRNTFFGRLSSQYKWVIQSISNSHKVSNQVTYSEAIELLNKLLDLQGRKDNLVEQQSKLYKYLENIRQFKDYFKDAETKLSELNAALTELSNHIISTYNNIKTEIANVYSSICSNIEVHNKDIADAYGKIYAFIGDFKDSELQGVVNKATWVLGIKEKCKYKLSEYLISRIENGSLDISELYTDYMIVKEWVVEYENQVGIFNDLFENYDIHLVSLKDLRGKIKACSEHLDLLEVYVDYKHIMSDINKYKLNGFIDKIDKVKISNNDIVNAYKKCFYRSWLDANMSKFELLSRFRCDRQNDKIDDFRELDIEQLGIARNKLYNKLNKEIPNLNFSGLSNESTLLRRELSKKRSGVTIRKLIAQIPNLLVALKPCIMMSPLSVSTYFSESDFKFDTVIFDEASQICTEDAICSIFRAKQVIIAGDSKQLPPTSFFGASDDLMAGDEDDMDIGVYESLLDEASIFPTQTLLWHYRSKHEHLITFSNYEIYNRTLVTFPSAINKQKDLGVEFEYVKNGIYEKGAKGGNILEAERICELLKEHFDNHPDRSIGIIAFGERQQSVIEDAVMNFMVKYKSYEKYFNGVESVFIRNLESVQGDERDTIILSVGYGFDYNGKFSMNFGPLNKVGGERRLNVAITRARYNLKVVASFLPTDMRVDNLSSVGPVLLRDFLEFAMHSDNKLNSNNDKSKLQGKFEQSIYDYLVSEGYTVRTMVGCSDYRIDMAVCYPGDPDKYVIGIECDGHNYSSARTARERDRLRQSVLNNMGWKLYRIWSIDWIKSMISERNKLKEAIDKAIKEYGVETEKVIEPEVKSSDTVTSKSTDIKKTKVVKKETYCPSITAASIRNMLLDGRDKKDTQVNSDDIDKKVKTDITFEDKDKKGSSEGSSEGSSGDSSGSSSAVLTSSSIRDMLSGLRKANISQANVYQENNSDSAVQANNSDSAVQADTSDSIVQANTVVADTTDVDNKYKSKYYGYKIEDVPHSDIHDVIYKIVRDKNNIVLEDLIRLVAVEGYGCRRIGKNIRNNLLSVINMMYNNNELVMLNGCLRVK